MHHSHCLQLGKLDEGTQLSRSRRLCVVFVRRRFSPNAYFYLKTYCTPSITEKHADLGSGHKKWCGDNHLSTKELYVPIFLHCWFYSSEMNFHRKRMMSCLFYFIYLFNDVGQETGRGQGAWSRRFWINCTPAVPGRLHRGMEIKRRTYRNSWMCHILSGQCSKHYSVWSSLTVTHLCLSCSSNGNCFWDIRYLIYVYVV